MSMTMSQVGSAMNALTVALYNRSKESGDVPARRFREIPPGQSFDPHALSRFGNWRIPDSTYVIDEYTFVPQLEVTASGEVFDLDPVTLQRHYSLANSPAEFTVSLSI